MTTKCDCLARSVPDARNIVDGLIAAGCGSASAARSHDPADRLRRLPFSPLVLGCPVVGHAQGPGLLRCRLAA